VDRTAACPLVSVLASAAFARGRHRPAQSIRSGGILTNGMSIKVSYKDGVFAPLEKVEGAKPDAVYTVFSDEELRDIRET